MPSLIAQLFRTGELERMSEAALARLRARAEAREEDGATVIAAVCGLAAAVVWAGSGYGLAWLMAAVNAARRSGVGAAAVAAPSQNLGRFTVVNLLFAAFAGFVAYRLVREWRMAKTMRRLLNRAGCPFCEFSLVGLKPKMGAVTCPECGELVVLDEHHIPPDALVLPHMIPIPDSGPLGALSGEVPTGKKRRITRSFGGIPRRSSTPAKPSGGSGGGEIL